MNKLRKIKKDKWPRGPWHDEPDQVVWQDEETGLDCEILRTKDAGSLCGYVGIPESHPFHGRSTNILSDDLRCHGGVTFADRVKGKGDLWWIGFDCAHLYDLQPGYFDRAPFRGDDAIYRTVEYVRCECEWLARQLASAARES